MHALFVFAHQDDEVAAAARIAYLVRARATITCVYLTNGEGRRASSAVRDEESRRVLAHLGVDLARVHFLGSQERIPDGALVEHLDRVLALVESRITEVVDEVWCLAWEGGHQDHDASHLIAVAFAARRGLLDRTFEMPLYRAHRLFSFQTLAPLRVGKPWVARRIGFYEAMRHLALCRFYRSQRKTWIGLLPTAILRMPVEWTRAVDVARLSAPPHERPLLYETRFGVTWEEFERRAKAAAMAAALLNAAPRLPSGRDRPTRDESR